MQDIIIKHLNNFDLVRLKDLKNAEIDLDHYDEEERNKATDIIDEYHEKIAHLRSVWEDCEMILKNWSHGLYERDGKFYKLHYNEF